MHALISDKKAAELTKSAGKDSLVRDETCHGVPRILPYCGLRNETASANYVLGAKHLHEDVPQMGPEKLP